jgi:hypothetical protein
MYVQGSHRHTQKCWVDKIKTKFNLSINFFLNLNEQILITWNPPKKTFFFARTVHEKVKEKDSRQTGGVCAYFYILHPQNFWGNFAI